MQETAAADFMDVFAPGFAAGSSRGLAAAAAPRPETFITDRLFNEKPPDSTITFLIGGVLFIISFGMWLQRLQKLKERKQGDLHGADLLRGMIACAIDNDSPYYTIVSYSAISFIFLGGIQVDYQITFLAMIGYYCIVSAGDTLRVLLAYWQYGSLSDVFIVSDMDVGLKDKHKEDKEEKDQPFETMELQPNNIYEDMGREKTIVFMIFATQIIFVTFVCIDVYRADKVSCLDGTPNCPVGGTLGSYGFYIMGIFQACVYLLGPKTNYGQSEQNPGFWLILLLASKKRGARLFWENPVKDASFSRRHRTLKDSNGNVVLDDEGNPKMYHSRDLHKNDLHMWCRFFMSYLVNGVGFHILVHTLPVQVAAQSSFTGVVFRAVGMLYLVDLDDTKGFKLIITEKDDHADDDEVDPKEGTADENKNNEMKEIDEEQVRPSGDHSPLRIDTSGEVSPVKQEQQQSTRIGQEAIAAEAEDIIEEAEQRLQDLLKNGPSSRSFLRQRKNSKVTSSNSVKNVIGFGCIPMTGTSSTSNQGEDKKKNSAQAAILQASVSAESGGGGQGVEVEGGGAM